MKNFPVGRRLPTRTRSPMGHLPRHGTDAVSLIFGLVFLLIAGWWLFGRAVSFNVPNLGWLVAAALILMGLLGIAGSLRGDKASAAATTHGEPQESPADEEPIVSPDDTDTTETDTTETDTNETDTNDTDTTRTTDTDTTRTTDADTTR